MISDQVAVLTMADIQKAADELAYRRAPAEARLNADSLIQLRLILEPDPTKPTPPPTLLGGVYGVSLIVDQTLPPRRIEFRDADGEVISTVEIPA